jgi:hypothetical protein
MLAITFTKEAHVNQTVLTLEEARIFAANKKKPSGLRTGFICGSGPGGGARRETRLYGLKKSERHGFSFNLVSGVLIPTHGKALIINTAVEHATADVADQSIDDTAIFFHESFFPRVENGTETLFHTSPSPF